MRRLLLVLAAVLLFDAALIFGAKPIPVATVITREPLGAPSRAAPRSAGPSSASVASSGNAAPVVNCTTPPPSPTWSCQNGAWVMVGASATADGGAGNCPSAQPGAGWTCRGGTWTPPNSSAQPSGSGVPDLATSAPPPASTPALPTTPSDTSPSLTPAQTGCTTPNPAAGMPGVVARCVNGTWVIGG